MTDPTIAFVNRSSAALNPTLAVIVEALKIQLEKHFGPVWGVSAKLYAVGDGKAAKPGEWQVVFLDDADEASDLGYHLLTKEGQPVSKVFMTPIREAKESESVTASHELL